MVQSIFQLWIWEPVIIIFLWTSFNTKNNIQFPFWQVWIHQGTLQISSGSSLFSRHIRKVFEKLWSAKLPMKLSKFYFFSKEIHYLGHILSTKGICLLPSKTQVIQQMHPPTTPKQVHAFLGLIGYYRKFIKDFTKIAKLITLLIKQQIKFEWTPEHQEAFMKLKDAIIQALILWYPNPSKRYVVYTDASDEGCRAQLT